MGLSGLLKGKLKDRSAFSLARIYFTQSTLSICHLPGKANQFSTAQVILLSGVCISVQLASLVSFEIPSN